MKQQKSESNPFLSKGLCRIPLLSFNHALKLSSEDLKKLSNSSLIKDAILLASPSFYEEINKWLNGKIKNEKRINRIEQALYKYIVRMSARCTPFGLFGSTSYIDILSESKPTSHNFIIDDKIKIHARIDTCALQLLINFSENNKTLRKFIKFTSNNSVYDLGSHLRYFEPSNSSDSLFYDLAKVSKVPILEKILEFCKEPKTPVEIAKQFISQDLCSEEILSFIDELIEAKLLLSELEIVLTETDPMDRFIFLIEQSIKKCNKEKYFSKELSIIKNISNILKNDDSSLSAKYKKVIQLFNELEIIPKKEDVIHVDSYRNIKTINIDSQLLDELYEAKTLLLKLAPSQPDTFKQFKMDFERRYGEREMSLLHVLDPETGIGYMQKNEQGDDMLLLKGIDLSNHNTPNNSRIFSNTESFLLEKFIKNNKEVDNEINIELEELEHFPKNNSTPESFSAFFSLIKNGQGISLEEFSGSSAVNLMNRFSYMDERIYNLCKEIVSFEQQSNPECILAEINHLPELKSGNLLLNKELRDFEIPCVTVSKKLLNKKILLSDIKIKLNAYNEIQLFSERYRKQILPKLSNALNYNRNSIDIFKFLADIQFQNKTPVIHFDWYGLKELFDYFPRVNYKRIILSPALWIVKNNELINDEEKQISFEDKLNLWMGRRKIPKYVYLALDAKDDYKLFIDFTSQLGIEVFKKELLKSKKVVLVEAIGMEGVSVDTEIKDHYLNEIILPILEQIPHKEHFNSIASVNKQEQKSSLKCNFHPGSEWMYFKIYAGHVVIDELLSNQIPTLVTSLFNDNLISKWFYVRYSDDDFHLRIRFLLNSETNFNVVLKKVEQLLYEYTENDIVHNVVMDTYKREISRYGYNAIKHCEKIFTFDSFAVCDILRKKNSEEERWLFGVIGIDSYLNDFGFNIDEKIEIMGFIANQFFMEFGITKDVKIQLNNKYREHRNLLFAILDKDRLHKKKDFEHIFDIITDRSVKCESTIQTVLQLKNLTKIKLKDIVLSIIHMFLNRLFNSNHRKQELVLYYMLLKHYESIKAIKNKNRMK